MAGYSGTPLGTKLGIKEGHRVLFVREPATLRRALGVLPKGVVAEARATKHPYDVVVLFVKTAKELTRDFPKFAKLITPAGGLWIGWPKESSGVETDVTENLLRAVGLPTGLVDNKVCAIDETWSGLRFVVRVENRATSKPRR